jgi:hypothetical protein
MWRDVITVGSSVKDWDLVPGIDVLGHPLKSGVSDAVFASPQTEPKFVAITNAL